MANNIDVTPGTGKTVAAEDIGGVIFQRIKLIDPTLTSTTGIGIAANPLQVSLANTAVNAVPVTVDNTGTFAVQSTAVTPGTAATSLGKAEDAAHTSGDVGVMSLVVRNDTRGTLAGANGDYAPIQTNSSGDVRVDGSAVTQPVSGTVSITANSAVNLSQVAGTTTAANAGSATAGTLRVVIATDQPQLTNALKVDGSGVTQPVSGTVSVNPHDIGSITTSVIPGTGATALGKAEDAAHTSGDVGIEVLAVRNDTRGTLSGTNGDYTPFQLNASGDLRVDASAVAVPVTDNAGSLTVDNAGTFAIQAQPTTSGGLLVALMGSADGSTALTNTAQAIKASAGQLYGWYIYNPNATATYVSIYNVAAGSVTVGTTNPQLSLDIPATSAANILGAVGIEFTNAGFSAAATTTGGGNTAPGTPLEANFFYK